MIFWILAVLLMASLAGLGLRQGAIRVAFSFVGILLGVLLAGPLGHLIRPLISAIGIKNVFLLALIPPCIGFLIVSMLFKTAALVVHRKVEVYYKYQAGDLRLALWDRLNHRLGLCLGLVNGAAYLVIVSMFIYVLSYWTVQVAMPESTPKGVQILNRLGKDMESTGMTRVAKAVEGFPTAYYDAADIVGMIYHTPKLGDRVARYPAVLGLLERPEFQDLASDASFTNLWAQQGSIMDVLKYPKVQAILQNSDQVKAISDALVPNLKDMSNYLATGLSPKFDPEKILGRWLFDMNGSVALQRKSKPSMSPAETSRLRGALMMAYFRTTFVATPDQQAFLKNFPRTKTAAGTAPTMEYQTLSGNWKGAEGIYQVTFSGQGETTAEIQGERLSIAGLGIAFIRDE